jgi:hypothetical protein
LSISTRSVGALTCCWGSRALDGDPPSASDVTQVLAAAAMHGPVVVDLGRTDHSARRAAVQRADLAVLLASSDVAGLAAAHAVVRGMGRSIDRAVLRRGSVGARDAAAVLGVEVAATLRPARPGQPLRVSRSLARVAGRLLCPT